MHSSSDSCLQQLKDTKGKVLTRKRMKQKRQSRTLEHNSSATSSKLQNVTDPTLPRWPDNSLARRGSLIFPTMGLVKRLMMMLLVYLVLVIYCWPRNDIWEIFNCVQDKNAQIKVPSAHSHPCFLTGNIQ